MWRTGVRDPYWAPHSPVSLPQPRLHSISSVRRPHVVVQIIALATIYVLAARLGLAMDAVSGFATLVWPPTGIALSALILRGFRLWPGIAIGALIANLMVGAPVLIALGIATGNTLEAVVGAWMLSRLDDFNPSLERLRNVLAFIGMAALLAPVVSATIGVASLQLGGIVATDAMRVTWTAWWLGDAMGALLIAPPIMVWAAGRAPVVTWQRAVEAIALALILVIVGWLMFLKPGDGKPERPVAYQFFPLLGWAAVRFGQRGAVTATLAVSAIAIWGTALGHGPFAEAELFRGLFAVQTFMAVAATSFMVLGASIAEREAAESALRSAHTMVTTANRAKADFLAVMSHELRTPLNAISGYVELLTLGVDGTLSPKQREALARIQRSQAHLLSLIEDILGFAKIEAGRVSLTPEPVPAGDIVRSVLLLIEPDVERKRLTLTIGTIDPAHVVRADPEKLRQVLLNLLTNATKFTPSGGRIHVGAEREFDRIRFTVTDTGIGIPEDQFQHVFEPFVQLEHGRTRRYSGIGLGLSIARDLVAAMGGEVKLESKLGEGTTVSVLLPAVVAAAVMPSAPPATERTS